MAPRVWLVPLFVAFLVVLVASCSSAKDDSNVVPNNDDNSTTDNTTTDNTNVDNNTQPDTASDTTTTDDTVPDEKADNPMTDTDTTVTDEDVAVDTETPEEEASPVDDAVVPDADEEVPEDENPFIFTAIEPESTFGIDVDTASYSIVRRNLTYNKYMPLATNVRIEELINYFDYTYTAPAPGADHPFSVTVEMGLCPWYAPHDLLMIGLKGEQLTERMPSNLMFLIDVSGSMEPADRLPLLKTALLTLVDNLGDDDSIGIIKFSDAATEALAPTKATASGKVTIRAAVNSLTAGGSTNGGAGIQMAYTEAEKNLDESGNNRVILATDGEFNTGGFTTTEQLTALIKAERDKKIFLTVLTFGDPNFIADGNMEALADTGNGNYYYIDSLEEAHRVFTDRLAGTIYTIAKDVKVQVEFNPSKVLKYRLIGYDNRVMENSEFNDDKVDSGELGAGHTVTAFYQIEYVDGMSPFAYAPGADDFVEVRVRYKPPLSDESTMMAVPVTAEHYLAEPSENFRFASAVTEWGLLLRDSYYKFDASYDGAKTRAAGSLGKDPHGLRAQFVTLIDLAKEYDN
ncbi:MAG TPA: von Willebrand factor type A domain-containing protein [bacterium]|nr:von Willebrand factor type A domain-containing protein [bacterium]